MNDSPPDPQRRQLALAAFAVATSSAAASPASAAAGLRIARLGAEERFGIEDLFARYAWTYDCTDEAGYLGNFTDDAIVVGANPGQFYRGREAIRGWFRYLIELRNKEGDDWLHDAYHHRLFGDRRACVVYSYATHYNSSPAGGRPGVRSAGYFVSQCVQRNGEWLFSHHSVNRWDRQALPWNKPLPWDRAAPATPAT